MFDLVNDVEAYPQFYLIAQTLKSFRSTIITDDREFRNIQGGYKKWFTTENTFIDEQTVQLRLVDGPFKTLKGRWHFQALDKKACKVELKLEFEFL
ncbi:SRPBCC family protein [Pseudoalteromonas sp. Hal099]